MNLLPRQSKKFRGICFIATIAFPLMFHMGPHIKRISKNHVVTVIGSNIVISLVRFFNFNVVLRDIYIARKPNIICDVLALIKLIRIFRENNFRCVHSITPKAGLISMIAAFLARTPIRIHTFTGQVWASKKGIVRCFYMFMDWTMAFFSTHVLADSYSQCEFLISSGIVNRNKINVLGNGSIVGVDTLRFKPDALKRAEIRKEHGIGCAETVFIFVGRLAVDKGVADLLIAFSEVAKKCTNSHLFVVGPDEADFDIQIDKMRESLNGRIHRVKLTTNPEWYMAASDILCMPSYREGFGSVIIEGASVGLPSIASRIYGLSDAVIEGETGVFHEAGSIPQIIKAMLELHLDVPKRTAMGVNARINANQNFPENLLTEELESFYLKLGVYG